MMLGAGDADSESWVSSETFRRDYAALIDFVSGFPRAPSVYVCLPCKESEPSKLSVKEDNLNLERAAIQTLAQERGLPVVDVVPVQGRAFAPLLAEAVYGALTGCLPPPRVNSYFNDHMGVASRC